MNVLSLFDGISAGQLALKNININVSNYYASEVDKYAIKIANKNFPNTKQLGDVTKWKDWNIDLSSIDLLIGGSPCQGFSFAGKQLNFNDDRSKLFFDYVDILNYIKSLNPNVKFLLENVRMKKEYQDVISDYMGVSPIVINSSLVSAQNRVRYYWTNINNIEQPKDKGYVLSDVLEIEVDSKYYLNNTAIDYMNRLRNGKPRWEFHKNPLDGKSACLVATQYKGYPLGVLRLEKQCIVDDLYKNRPERIYEDKSPTLRSERNGLKVKLSKCEQIATLDMKGNDCIRRVYNENGKSPCLTTSVGGHRQPKIFDYEKEFARKLTPTECERLQTFPDNYTEGISNSQRYKALGNSWTVDVISHIFKNL